MAGTGLIQSDQERGASLISLEGRKIIIVGGGSGIGWAAAQLAAKLGAIVTVADVEEAAGDLVSSLGREAGFVRCDATKPEQVSRMLAQVVDRCGELDGLFVTVGGAHIGPVATLDLASWDAELTFNLTSVYVVCRGVLPYLERRGGGSIVTTSSGYAMLPGPDRAGYTAAKAGVIAFTRSLAMAAASSNIRANCIAPGPTDTPRFRAMNGGDAGVERVRQGMPLGKIPEPIDCANVAIFLLSDAASQVTGQVIHVNGGLLMP
jgi:NAD(P)-dependent dehydrogenase (short-subunit alcohol dehydrogenase family)